jgi:hypothetical protein
VIAGEHLQPTADALDDRADLVKDQGHDRAVALVAEFRLLSLGCVLGIERSRRVVQSPERAR